MTLAVIPWVEVEYAGGSVRFGFRNFSRGPAVTALYPPDLSAELAVQITRDLVKRLEWSLAPEMIERPPAPPVSLMSAEYGT